MSTDQPRRALRDVDFPAGKDELIRAAQASGAPGEAIRALRAIPPEEYANRGGGGALGAEGPGRGTPELDEN
jgi:Protein of unknown function (DUF2795)